MPPEIEDPEVAKVYEAEDSVRAAFDRATETGDRRLQLYQTMVVLPQELWFTDQDDVQRYVDRVCARAGWPKTDVFMKAEGQSAHYWLKAIHLPYARWAFRELVVLHETAHHGASHKYGLGLIDGHGREFRETFISLVRTWMGPETALLLRAAYSSTGCTT